MNLKEEERQIVVSMELEKAERTFAETTILLQNKLWSNLANRLYYVLFHSVSALLIYDGYEVGTHKGAVIRFHQYYVKTGLFSPEEGAFYSQMQSLRERADYNCFYDVSETEVTERIEPTRQFLMKIRNIINGKKIVVK